MTTAKWIVALVALSAVVGGCLGDDGNSAPTTTTPEPSGGTQLTDTTPPGPDQSPNAIPIVRLHNCLRAWVGMYVPAESVATRLPLGFVAGDFGPLAFLYLDIQQCESLTVGNTTVVKPFSHATLYASVEARQAYPDITSYFQFENVVSDQPVAHALQALGFTTSTGTVDLQALPVGLELRVESGSVAYDGTIIRVDEGNEPNLHAERVVYAQSGGGILASHVIPVVTLDDSLLQPTTLSLAGGSASEIIGAPVYLAVTEISYLSQTLDYARCDDRVINCALIRLSVDQEIAGEET